MQGHLVIADISGYTQFLTDSELDHANGVMSDLLNAIVGAMDVPLAVSGIEGDAVFMFGDMAEGMTGQTVVESVELIYCAFKSSLEHMVQNTTCQCNACVNIQGLGLKIVMHCGEFMKTTVGGITSLSGPDVIAVHRLLKNHVVERTGIVDYLLVTDACVTALGIETMVAAWTPHSEGYEHIGEVSGYVADLSAVWEYRRMQTEVKVHEREAWWSYTTNTVAPPAVVWDHLIDPRKRIRWLVAAAGVSMHGTTEGRVSAGTEFHCEHGDDSVTVFSLLDLRPYDYVTILASPVPDVYLTWTYYLIPSGSGTRIVVHSRPPHDVDHQALDQAMAQMMYDPWDEGARANVDELVAMTNEFVAAAGAPVS